MALKLMCVFLLCTTACSCFPATSFTKSKNRDELADERERNGERNKRSLVPKLLMSFGKSTVIATKWAKGSFTLRKELLKDAELTKENGAIKYYTKSGGSRRYYKDCAYVSGRKCKRVPGNTIQSLRYTSINDEGITFTDIIYYTP